MRLTTEAKDTLRDAGITQAGWARLNYGPDTTRWTGDKCGCPDDRCIGNHHQEDDACGCLPALLGSTI